MKYSEVHRRSSSVGEKVRRFFSLLFPIAVFFFAVWLIFVRFRQSPMSEIEEYIAKKDYKSSVAWLNTFLDKETITRPKLLMYGTIVQFGLREQDNEEYNLPDYQAMLRKEDTAKIFLKESYLRRLKLFPRASYMPELICNLSKDFGKSFHNEESLALLATAIANEKLWRLPSENCKQSFFNSTVLKEQIYVTTGDKLQLREEPNLEALVITRLDKNIRVISRKQGAPMSLGGKTHNWHFVFTETNEQGWLYGKYLKTEKKPD